MEEKWWQKDSDIPLELNDKTMFTNKSEFIKNSEWDELHNKLVQTVIDFFKDKGLPKDSWAVNFEFDDLKASVDYGKWCPMSDSVLELISKDRDSIMFSM